ncbi:hypothetical protein ACHHYP_06292 [Achlya hypogyna]|uniref:Uncharacterized protein n=1 Tax=Achlya hypogyna TaxID=1202772 RepID=A0A1V9YUL6_ACHHY|nr:hypothetical protein ACHHYP_06292 [Achlya hypogyna]
MKVAALRRKRSTPPAPWPASAAMSVLTTDGLVSAMVQFQHGLSTALAQAFAGKDHRDHTIVRGLVLCGLLETQQCALAHELLLHFATADAICIPWRRDAIVYTLDYAAASGDVALLARLHERRLGFCSTNALDVAAAHGD